MLEEKPIVITRLLDGTMQLADTVQPTPLKNWDGYPPNRTDGKFHWLRISPAVADVMRWEDGRWISTRFGERIPPSHAKHWTYIGLLMEPS